MSIKIIGAKENNLKDIEINLPINKLIVFTGISGSGKSSLAFDTIHKEGQRRYLETFSSYAKIRFRHHWKNKPRCRSAKCLLEF